MPDWPAGSDAAPPAKEKRAVPAKPAKPAASSTPKKQDNSAAMQAIVALVNDEPITGYEVDQRMRLALLGTPELQKRMQAKLKAPDMDERFKQFALKRLKNADIVEAQDGMDGLRKVTSDHFDLALVDINMPVMDGLKLISLIRAEDNLKTMRICVITTEGAQEDRERALALGADEYLTKPIQANRVLAIAKSLLKID